MEKKVLDFAEVDIIKNTFFGYDNSISIDKVDIENSTVWRKVI